MFGKLLIPVAKNEVFDPNNMFEKGSVSFDFHFRFQLLGSFDSYFFVLVLSCEHFEQGENQSAG